ncbi:MAG: hypothetical protein ABIU05_08780, partial [Nitrospirales bacterium]
MFAHVDLRRESPTQKLRPPQLDTIEIFEPYKQAGREHLWDTIQFEHLSPHSQGLRYIGPDVQQEKGY